MSSSAVRRPFICINMAMTADGKITSAGREYPTFTSRYDRRNMDRLRAEADGLMVGAGTIRADDPPLHVRDPSMQAHRRSIGKPAGLTRVLVTASADVSPDSRFFDRSDDGARIVATVDSAPDEHLSRLPSHTEIWRLGRDSVDLGRVLERLRERGVERLLVEGGGELNWALIDGDWLDELYVTLAPALLGGRDAPTLLEGAGLRMADRRRLRLVEVHREGDELYCRYAVER